MNIRITSYLGLLAGAVLLTACHASALLPMVVVPTPTAKVQQVSDKVQVKLNLSPQAGINTLQVKNGSAFQLFKEDKLLLETVVKNNQVQFTPVDAAPPYRYSMPDATVIETLMSKGPGIDTAVPIDTQGGLLPSELPQVGAQPIGGNSSLLERAVTNAPETIEHKNININGTITEDLRVAKIAKIERPLAIAQLKE